MTSWIHRRSAAALVLLAGGLVFFPAARSAAADAVTFEALMIHASDQPAPIDRRLEHIEYKLRKVFGFEHYRHAGEGTLVLNPPGEGTISLGGTYALRIEATGRKGGRIRTRVTWTRGQTTLLNTATWIGRGAPATVLGGASEGGGTLIVTLRVR